MLNEIKEKINTSEMLLIALGEDIVCDKDERDNIIEWLKRIVKHKNYYIISLNNQFTPEIMHEFEGHIVFTWLENENLEKDWEYYTLWLQGTLNKVLILVELEVGLKYPNVVRWPFEKIAYFNMKSTLIRIHKILAQVPQELQGKANSIKMDVNLFVKEVLL